MAATQLNYSTASKSMFGPQVVSSRGSAPAAGFGTSGHNQNVYISQEHEKTNFGRIGPGPAMYNQQNIWVNSGREVSSTKNSAPCSKMGKSQRFFSAKDPKLPHGTPGPGHYVY
eukprot:TRINITY_DN576_c0_g1_i1.p1 TRINITY_DN576_c0_g1~~TRINITY_DN576_c0_g1_i1.p1  ORF type:complete len:114 (-),score=17.05 TRINITY_DN576_c0_g1_i1:288-629(-)